MLLGLLQKIKGSSDFLHQLQAYVFVKKKTCFIDRQVKPVTVDFE